MIYLIAFLVLWCALGALLIYVWPIQFNKKEASITRVVDKRICRVGDMVYVDLTCSSNEFPDDVKEQEIEPWDIYFLLDHSISMGSGNFSALEKAKQAALTMVKTMPVDFRFSVIEFDHSAQELVELTKNKRVLEQGISSIVRGGGTDIAVALQVADVCVQKPKHETDRKTAVILLSDGESHYQSAIDAAEKLKQRVTSVVTVGVFGADQELMKQLASDESLYFNASNIKELTLLYNRIGELIIGKSVANVRVDSDFAHGQNWAFRGCGDIAPADFDASEGKLSWVLPTLTLEPMSLSYHLRAERPGWHQIVKHPAQLSAMWNEQEQSFNSGKNHKVLVLPSYCFWLGFGLLINPLWFKLFARFYRQKQSVATHELDKPIIPQKLKLPAQIVLPQSPLPNLVTRPTLVIGVGYAGIQTLVHVKRQIWEREARINHDNVKVLAIDLASDDYFPSPSDGLVTIENHERIELPVLLESIIAVQATQADGDYPWLDAKALYCGGVRPDLGHGTGNQRAIGRLAVFANQQVLQDKLQDLLSQIKQTNDGGIQREIDVVITASSGGGTGSGMVLDLAWLLQICAQDLSISLNTHLIMSSPYAVNDQQTKDEVMQLRLNNHQALLREASRINATRGQLLGPHPDKQAVRNWFDGFYCVGGSQIEACSGNKQVYPQTAEIIFTWLVEDQQKGVRSYFDRHAANFINVQSANLHRLEPMSLYLFPRTIKRYLAINFLRNWLVDATWLANGQLVKYQSFANKHKQAEAILSDWLEAQVEEVNKPWLLRASSFFDDIEIMQQQLLMGAGPCMARNVTGADEQVFIQSQMSNFSALLDRWIAAGLNQGVEGICEHFSLSIQLQALAILQQRIKDLVGFAYQIIDADVDAEPLLLNEVQLIIELGELASTQLNSKIQSLVIWDQYLGEGVNRVGVASYFDHQLEVVRHSMHDLMVQTSPKLPLTEHQIDQLGETYLNRVLAELPTRIMWQQPEQGDTQWQVVIQGEQSKSWRIEELLDDSVSENLLAEALIGLVYEIAADVDNWHLQDLLQDSTQTLQPQLPRQSGLSMGAKSVCLVANNVQNRIDCASETYEPLEAYHTLTVIGCETQLSPDKLWMKSANNLLPYIFDEEHHGYRGYENYCVAHNLIGQLLPVALLRLCQQPEYLLSFVCCALYDDALKQIEQQFGTVWVIEMAQKTVELAKNSDDLVETVSNAITAWGEKIAPHIDFTLQHSSKSLEQIIRKSQLFTPIAYEEFTEMFIALIVGFAIEIEQQQQ